LRRIAERLAPFGAPGRVIRRTIEAVAYSHGTIHHASYAGSYVHRFAPAVGSLTADAIERERVRRKSRIDTLVAARPLQEQHDVVVSDYGVSLSHPVQDALLVGPAVALAAWVVASAAGHLGAGWSLPFVGVAAAVSLLFLPASNYVHPYLHMTRLEAFAAASAPMRWLLRSRYVQHIAQSHYVHHRDASVNHNLIPGADLALGYRATRLEAVLVLRRLETFF
jgi:hypothetical protein